MVFVIMGVDKMKRWLSVVALTMVACAFPARAATYLLTFQGTITGVSQYSGKFGPDPQGKAFKAVYTFSVPDLEVVETAIDPHASAVFSFDGYSQTINAPRGSAFTQSTAEQFLSFPAYIRKAYATVSGGRYDQAVAGTYLTTSLYEETAICCRTTFDLAAKIPFYTDPVHNFPVSGYGQYVNILRTCPGNYRECTIDALDVYDLTNSRLSIERAVLRDGRYVPASVPEPAAWMTMIAGFVLMGGALRWRGGRFARRSPTAIGYAAA